MSEAKVDSERLIQPLPWSTRPNTGKMATVVDALGVDVFHGVTMDEAQMISAAVNSHEALVSALKKWRGGACGCSDLRCLMCRDFDAALALAESTP